jgi:tripartite-type tricarboxylate transporter receptor subunit TctC
VKLTRNPLLILLSLLVALESAVVVSAATLTDSFPTRPIRWIVPYPAGGPTDMVARIVGERLGERLKQPVIVENLAGAFGNIGMEAGAHAAPDGHTIVFAATSMVLNAPMYNFRPDPLTELTPVSQITTTTYVLVGSAGFAPRTLEEVLAAAKAKPGTVTCGWGATLFQLGCELLRLRGKVDIMSVPYKGNAPAMNDLVAGHINLLFDPINTALPQIESGRARAIATARPERGGVGLVNLPAVAETLPGFELTGWFGVLAPAATPRAIVERLNREIAALLEEEGVRKRLTDAGLEVTHGSPEAFAELIQRDQERYAKVIREAGIKPD